MGVHGAGAPVRPLVLRVLLLSAPHASGRLVTHLSFGHIYRVSAVSHRGATSW